MAREPSPEMLGEAVAKEVARNPDGCEVPRAMLAELGIPLNSEAYVEWVNRWKLRQCRPGRLYVCFVRRQ